MNFDPEDVLKTIDSMKKVIDYFKPFKPEVKAITINYRTYRSRVEFVVFVPDSIRRKFFDIEIPAYQGYRIVEMRDESFNRIEALWTYKKGRLVLDTKNLPSSERFLIVLEGKVPSNFVKRIVRVQPAINRDQSEEYDRYWLSCMLKDVTILERIWNSLEVEEVSVNVKVGIEKCFSAALPKEVKKALEATRELLAAGRGKSRDEIIRAWSKYRQAVKKAPSADQLIDLIYKVTDGSFFRNYVTVDDPYSIRNVRRDESFPGPFPEKISVEAVTFLNLRTPEAKGYLTFKKKSYIEAIRQNIGV